MLNCGACVGPLVLVAFILPEHEVASVYSSVEKAGRRMLPAMEKDLEKQRLSG